MTSGIFRELERLYSLIGWQIVVGQNLLDLGKSHFLHFCQNLGFLAMSFDSKALDCQSSTIKTQILA